MCGACVSGSVQVKAALCPLVNVALVCNERRAVWSSIVASSFVFGTASSLPNKKVRSLLDGVSRVSAKACFGSSQKNCSGTAQLAAQKNVASEENAARAIPQILRWSILH